MTHVPLVGLALPCLGLVAAAQSQAIPTSLGLTLDATDDTLAIGGFGRVEVYERDVSGVFQLAVDLNTFVGTDSGFGVGLALDADTLAVGAPLELDAGEERGAAYLFERDQEATGSWNQVTRLAMAPAESGSRFGEFVALQGDTLAVAAPGSASKQGCVFTYGRDVGGPGNWGLIQTLSPPAGVQSVDFGRTLALDGDRLAVHGLRRQPSLEGVVQTYERVGGVWVESALLTPSSPNPFFGFALALSRDRLAVAAHANPGSVSGGKVHIYERGPTGWPLIGTVTPPDPSEEGFGWSLHLNGDRLAVGSPQTSEDPEAAPDTGVVHLFERDGRGNWHPRRVITSPVTDVGNNVFTAVGPWFGWDVARAGGELVVTAPFAISLERTFVYARLPRARPRGPLSHVPTPLFR